MTCGGHQAVCEAWTRTWRAPLTSVSLVLHDDTQESVCGEVRHREMFRKQGLELNSLYNVMLATRHLCTGNSTGSGSNVAIQKQDGPFTAH